MMLPLVIPASHIEAVHVLTLPLLLQHAANALGKTVEDGQRAWVPVTHVGVLEKAPGFSLGQVWLLRPFGE